MCNMSLLNEPSYQTHGSEIGRLVDSKTSRHHCNGDSEDKVWYVWKRPSTTWNRKGIDFDICQQNCDSLMLQMH